VKPSIIAGAFVCAFLATAGALSAGADKTPPKKPAELEKFRGIWTLVSYSAAGVRIRGEDPRCVFTFEDDRWHLSWRKDDGTDQIEQGVLRLNDGPLYPKFANLVHDRGAYKGTTTHVVYSIGGEVLRYTAIVLPADIHNGEDVQTSTMVWRRKKG
jgi:uncharacterized protein (TIGR03067 family)